MTLDGIVVYALVIITICSATTLGGLLALAIHDDLRYRDDDDEP